MASVNRVILLGNVGKDPEVRYPSEGQCVASLSLATTERGYTANNGTTYPDRTEWHNLVMWGRNAQFAEKYIRKGAQLYIEGKLRTRTYDDRNKIKHYITEVYVDTVELLSTPRAREPQQQA